MPTDIEPRYAEIRRLLAHLDLRLQSLTLLGRKMAAGGRSPATSSTTLSARSLQLSRECSSIIQRLCGHVEKDDVDRCLSARRLIDHAIERASNAESDLTLALNTWRVIEAMGTLVVDMGRKYGYTMLSGKRAVEPLADRQSGQGAVAEGVAVGAKTLVKEPAATKPLALPSFGGISRFRASQFLKRPGLILGVFIVVVFAMVAIAAPVIAQPEAENPYTIPQDGYEVDPEPPSAKHPLGTMEKQYDVLYGVVWGSRVAFKIGLSVTLCRALIGVLAGLVSGYYGGWLDSLMMRVTDAFLAFPIVPATLVMLVFLGGSWVAQVFGGGGVDGIVVVALILFGWMQYARLVRGNVLAERTKQYVEAAVSIGARSPRIILRHVLPNVPQGLFVLIASDVGAMVALSAVFTFLGLSGRAGLADWGWMLKVSRNWIVGTPSSAFLYWYTYLPPSLAIVLFSMGWNLIGDGLRDVLDARLR
jgi:peptide/nickel transport system permease protein